MPILVRLFRCCLWLLVGLLPALSSQAQSPAPAWESAISFGQRDLGRTIAADSKVISASVPDGQGNLYVSGSFVGTVTFGATTLVSSPSNGFTTTAYSSDIFVAKWSLRENRYLWVTRASGPGSEGATKLVVSGSNLYIAGETYSALSRVGSITFGSTALTTGTGYSIFIAKLTDTGTSGVWQWGKTGNNEYLAEVAGLAVSGTAVYVTGHLAGTMTLDGKTVKSNQTLAYNASDLLLLKLTDAGSTATLNWMQLFGTSTYERADALAVRGNTLYVAGNYSNTTTIGGTTLPNTGTGLSLDAFVTKFTDTGSAATVVWTQHLGGTGSDMVKSLVVRDNSLYLAGDFSSPSLGLGKPVEATLTNQDGPVPPTTDVFLAKLVDAGTSGRFAWAQQVGGVGSEQAAYLLQAGNALFLGGHFLGRTATFGNTVLTNASTQVSQADIYVARFDETATGAALNWVQRAGSSSYDFVYSLHLLGNQLYVQGYTDEEATFGPVTLPKFSSYWATLSPDLVTATPGQALLPTFTLAPNPAHSRLMVHIPSIAGATHVTLTLYDGLGRSWQAQTLSLPLTGLAYPWSVAALPPGIYAIHLHAGAVQAVRRVIVE